MTVRIDRRRLFALAAALGLAPRLALAAAGLSRFASGAVATGGGERTGRIRLRPDEVELEGARPLDLRKVDALAVAPRSEEAAAGADDEALVELAKRLLADPRDRAGIEAWLELLGGGYVAPATIGAPFAGTLWAVPDATRHHAAHAASAFALDLAVLGKVGRVREAKGERNEDWATWDAPLIAVADGRVARARDELPDDAPFQGVADPARANDLVLELEGGHLAFYQHLKQGSLVAKPGARVKRGDELARVGNSGNASWPHLHFAVYERFDGGTLSVPIAFERYALEGLKRDVEGKPKKLSVECRNVPLQEGWVVRAGA